MNPRTPPQRFPRLRFKVARVLRALLALVAGAILSGCLRVFADGAAASESRCPSSFGDTVGGACAPFGARGDAGPP